MTFLSSRKSTGASRLPSAPSSLPSSGSQVTLVDNSVAHPSAKLKASKVANDENNGLYRESKENRTKTASDFKVSAMAYVWEMQKLGHGKWIRKDRCYVLRVYDRLNAYAMAEVLYEGPVPAAEECLLGDWTLRLEEIQSRDMDDRGVLLDAAESARADFLLGADLEAFEKMAIVICVLPCLLGLMSA
ncbi:hypothetical protein BGZ72_001051 [Mortierella alpina]|nr:hypothetical protein BGZ72_001051 [Mortierella alpina]